MVFYINLKEKNLHFLKVIVIKKSTPWTNKFNAALREAFGLNIANGRRLDSPIFGTQVPRGIADIGNWSIGNDPEEFLKYLHIPENLHIKLSLSLFSIVLYAIIEQT